MEADYEIFELVTVTRDFWLFDAECYQRRYSTNHGQPLAPGYYVVNWPEHIRIRRFTKNAAFHGPFLCRKEAQAALDWMNQERKRVLSKLPRKLSIADSGNKKATLKKTVSQRSQPRADAIAKQINGHWNLG